MDGRGMDGQRAEHAVMAVGRGPAYVLLALTALVWGLAPVAARQVLLLIDPMQAALLRYLLVAPLFWPLIGPLWRRALTPPLRGRFLLCSLLAVAGYIVPYSFGARLISAGVSGLLLAIEPVMILLLSMPLLGERPGPLVWGGVGLSVVGLVCMIGLPAQPPDPGGVALVLLAALAWSVYTVVAVPLSRSLGAVPATAAVQLLGTLPLLAWAGPDTLTAVAGLGGQGWVALLFLAVLSTVAGGIGWNFALTRIPASQGGAFLYLLPVISLAGGVVLLDETVDGATVLSALLILAGVVLAQSRGRGRGR